MTQVSSLYLHVPFCMHLCNYCDFYKRRLENRGQQIEDFHQFLRASLKRQSELFRSYGVSWQELGSVYLGGGTPSLWGPEGAKFYQQMGLKISKECEFTMEIDPGTWSDDLLESWKELGLNRISIGTQTLDPDFLKIMDRVHTFDDSIFFLEKLHRDNWNFSLDFLLGIPFSKARSRDIQKELELLLQFNPKHISLYILNARSKYPYISDIPDEEYVREEYLFVSEFLRSRGFHHYEVSNFSYPGFESKHNLKYWKSENVAALGPTGTGYLRLSADQAVRYKWKVMQAEVEVEKLGPDEIKLEETYLRLRTSLGIPFVSELKCLYQSWEQQGFARLSDGQIRLTPLGYLMLDSLMDDLFRLEVQKTRANPP
jgi:oxygen-independent coproporphyrinogen-3 oxidase